MIILLLLAFVLSAAEVALYSLTSRKEKLDGKVYSWLLKSPQLFLSTILVSNAAAVFLLTLLGASIAIDLSVMFSFSKTVALAGEVVIVSGLLIIFADAVPKIVAAREAKTVAKFTLPLLTLLVVVESPIVFPLNSLLSRINARRKKSALTIDNEGLKTLSKIAANAGVIEENEAELLRKIAFLGERTVQDVMTSRSEITSISDESGFEKVVETLKRSEHSRLLVYSGTSDNIVGILYARDFLPYFRKKTLRRKFRVTTIVRKPVFVPESQSLEKLIETYRTNKVHIAVAVDEFGGLAGIVTLSDVVRGIFGSSAEAPRSGHLLTKLPDASYLVKGTTRLDEIVGEVGGLDLGSESVDTVSSLLINRHGSVPRVGTRIEVNNFEFEVEQATPKVILQVRLRRLDSSSVKKDD